MKCFRVRMSASFYLSASQPLHCASFFETEVHYLATEASARMTPIAPAFMWRSNQEGIPTSSAGPISASGRTFRNSMFSTLRWLDWPGSEDRTDRQLVGYEVVKSSRNANYSQS